MDEPSVTLRDAERTKQIYVYDEKGEDREYRIFLLTFEERDEVYHTRHMYAEMYRISDGAFNMGQDFYKMD